ncbi:MAG: MarR family winged helix-turn-helix transcriptional regulator [Desulfatibacillaceae bacterium]
MNAPHEHDSARAGRNACEDVLHALRRIMQAMDLHSRFLSREHGLTSPQLLVLREMTRRDGTSVGELARAVSLGQATVTGILDRLQNRGLSLRERSDSDKRKVLVRATASGKNLLREAPPVLGESFMREFTCLPEWEQTMILSSLQRMVSMMGPDRGAGNDAGHPGEDNPSTGGM